MSERVLYITCYIPLMIAAGLLLFACLRKDRSLPLVRIFIAFYPVLLCWLGLETLRYVLTNAWWLEYLLTIKLIFVALVPPLVLIIIAEFCRVELKKPLLLGLFAVPAITALIALTSMWHPLLVTGVTFRANGIISLTRGVWFYVHAAYCQLVFVCSVVLLATQARRMPVSYRARFIILYIAVSIYAAGVVVEMSPMEQSPIDFQLVGAILASILMYVAMVSNARSRFLDFAREDVFNYLDEAAFVLDATGRIVDANAAARALLRTVGEQLRYVPLSEVLQQLQTKNLLSLRKGEEGAGEDLYFIGTDHPLVYNMRKKPIEGGAGELMANVAILKDVTLNRLFIERLRNMAGRDELTGLANRHAYYEMRRELDVEKSLPLGIIMGDANGLKRINDTYGHSAGDDFLKAIASALKSCCPADGKLARIGGDEFIMLLPRCSEEYLEEATDCAQRELREAGLPFDATLAMGTAIKTDQSQSIRALIAAADMRMYSNKEGGK